MNTLSITKTVLMKDNGRMNLVLVCSFNQLEKLTITTLIYLTDVLKG